MRTTERTLDTLRAYRVPSPSEMQDIVLDLGDLAAMEAERDHYRTQYQNVVNHCRATAGRCFCGCHVSYTQGDTMHVEPHHPLAELLGQMMHGFATVPPKEQHRMVYAAIRAAVKWHKEALAAMERDRAAMSGNMKTLAEEVLELRAEVERLKR